MTVRRAVILQFKVEVSEMASNEKIVAITDRDGHIVAAQLLAARRLGEVASSEKEQTPSATLVPSDGQRAITIEVPREVLELPGPDFHRFLSHIKVTWPADVRLPEINVIRAHEK
jgi:hypothetical protein